MLLLWTHSRNGHVLHVPAKIAVTAIKLLSQVNGMKYDWKTQQINKWKTDLKHGTFQPVFYNNQTIEHKDT